MATFGDVMDRSAALMNDPNKRTYTYAVQTPYAKMAWDDLEGILLANDISVIKEKSAVIEYTADALSITSPSDLFLPLIMWEREDNSTNEEDWELMERKDWDADAESAPTLESWAWREQVIYVRPCSVNREVKLKYMKDISAIFTSDAATVSVDNAIQFLAFKTAYYLSAYLANNAERATQCNNDAGRAEDLLLTPHIKNNQFVSIRRRPYRPRRKVNSWR